MQLDQMALGIMYYLIFSLFGIIGYVLLAKIKFIPNYAKYIIAKPLGLIIYAYIIWLLASFHIIKFSNDLFVYGILGVMLFGSAYYLVKNNVFRRIDIKIFLTYEIFALFSVCFFLYFKGFAPAIEGTERYMDMIMFTSAAKTDYFPFFDPWNPSQDVNYYYYGFYIFSLLTRLSNIEFNFAYNFAFSIIYVNALSIAFALIYVITKSKFFSILGTLLLNHAGNLHYFACIARNWGEEHVVSGDPISKCWYPLATRIIDPSYTINEFPYYSYILGDLHPHVLSIPFFLLSLTLLYFFYKSDEIDWRLNSALFISMGTTALVNTWDFITLGGVFALIFFLKFIRKSIGLHRPSKKSLLDLKKWRDYLKEYFHRSWKLISLAILLAGSPFILFPAFFAHFKAPTEGSYGVGINSAIGYYLAAQNASRNGYIRIPVELTNVQKVESYEKVDEKTNEVVESSRVVGCEYVSTRLEGGGPNPKYTEAKKCSEDKNCTGPKLCSVWDRWVKGPVTTFQYPSSAGFLFGIWGTQYILIIISVLIIFIIATKQKRINFTLFFPLVLVLIGSGLILFTELFFLGDMFHYTSYEYFRANTIFKFGYHAWMLLWISVTILLAFAWKSLSSIKSIIAGRFFDVMFILLIAFASYVSFLYTYAGAKLVFNPIMPWQFETCVDDCKGNYNKENRNWTLDGLDYMKRNIGMDKVAIETAKSGGNIENSIKANADDYEVIKWLNENESDRIIILEAAGRPYTMYGRIAVNTGNANILNWNTHQWQWRFRYPYGVDSYKELFKESFIEGRNGNTNPMPDWNWQLIYKDQNEQYFNFEKRKLPKAEPDWNWQLLLPNKNGAYLNFIGEEVLEGNPQLVNRSKYDPNSVMTEEKEKIVKELYEVTDLNIDQVLNVLREYNVKYIYIGQIELLTYNVNEEMIKKIATPVIQTGPGKIYTLYKVN